MTKQNKINILVAVDGSKNSKRAIIEAKEYEQYFNAKITLLTVIKPVVSEYYTYIEPQHLKDTERFDAVGRSVLEKSLKTLGKSQDEVTMKARTGNPADEILQEIAEEKYDLLIMGSRGLGVFSRSFLGSVSNKVLHHTDINILIVK